MHSAHAPSASPKTRVGPPAWHEPIRSAFGPVRATQGVRVDQTDPLSPHASDREDRR
jgi:hypothetical protein